MSDMHLQRLLVYGRSIINDESVLSILQSQC